MIRCQLFSRLLLLFCLLTPIIFAITTYAAMLLPARLLRACCHAAAPFIYFSEIRHAAAATRRFSLLICYATRYVTLKGEMPLASATLLCCLR